MKNIELLLFSLVIGLLSPLYAQPDTLYFNDFDGSNSGQGWSHYALSGTDDWSMGQPAGIYISSPFSSPNVWKTKLNDFCTANSNMALETPYFDLSDTSVHYAFSFMQIRSSGTVPSSAFVEYSTDAGASWQLLHWPNVNKRNWQGLNGWTSGYLSYAMSAIDIWPLQGQDSVKFRFRYHSGSNTGDGWIIDNFSIAKELINLSATRGNQAEAINANFSEFTVTTDIHFDNQWGQLYSIDCDYYFSPDSLLDSSDIFLGRRTTNKIHSSLNNWSQTFALPQGLSRGDYYVIYELDASHQIVESKEADNINFAILRLDSLYSSPLAFHFDSAAYDWHPNEQANYMGWSKGDPDEWHMEDARSGGGAWLSVDSSYYDYGDFIVSPYIDLSNSTNTVFCLWYRSNLHYLTNFLRLQMPLFGNTLISYPIFGGGTNYEHKIPRTRLYDWDCHCKDLSDYDGEPSVRFRLQSLGLSQSSHHSKTAVDDIYIGPALPDVSLGGERLGRFTLSHQPADTLYYQLFNGGMQNLPATTTHFYWSADSLLDSSDAFLGSKQEVSLADTSFTSSFFSYSKPTAAAGSYYILYVADATEQVSEMREYDNKGYFKILQTDSVSLPYFNDFESQHQHWYHQATLGSDLWERSQPSGNLISQAFSGNQAFVTYPQGVIAGHHRMHLFTPVFDLSSLQHPVMEFDLFMARFGQNYNNWTSSLGNIMYSTDGGASWTTLDTTGLSFKRWYEKEEFEERPGLDQFPYPGSRDPYGDYLYGKQEKHFLNHSEYQGRNYDDVHHQVIDLGFLQAEDAVRFMFVYAHADAPVEGMMLDNFEISEAQADLALVTQKSLLSNGRDQRLRAYFEVKNLENYQAGPGSLKLYASIDTLLDSSDAFIDSMHIEALRPHQKQLLQLAGPTPSQWPQYRYLIVDIDPDNRIAESNESNNIGLLRLDMDSARKFVYPLIFDFNQEEIDGWTWYHDSSGIFHGHRFRHQTLVGEPNAGVQNGEWFLEKQDPLSHIDMDKYPFHYLESPAFDLRSVKNPEMRFDFRCLGGGYYTRMEGANMQYSTDGGKSWQLITNSLDPNRQNWYDQSSIKYLDNEPGWGEILSWRKAVFNLAFVDNEPNVRFRFKVHAKRKITSYAPQGFRMDNFEIRGSNVNLLNDAYLCQGDTLNFHGTLITSKGYYTAVLKDQNNMDSIVGISLVMLHGYTLNDTLQICKGDSIRFPDGSFVPAVYHDTTYSSWLAASGNGCDSIVNTMVKVFKADSLNRESAGLSYQAPADWYQWLSCDVGQPIAGANSSSYSPSANGKYALIVSEGGCVDTTACIELFDVGLNTLANQLGLRCYPNPSSGSLAVEYSNGGLPGVISLTNSMGQEVFRKRLYNGNKWQLQLNIPAGVYQLQLRSSEGIARVKIIIQ